jgi:hypothetical protein
MPIVKKCIIEYVNKCIKKEKYSSGRYKCDTENKCKSSKFEIFIWEE